MKIISQEAEYCWPVVKDSATGQDVISTAAVTVKGRGNSTRLNGLGKTKKPFSLKLDFTDFDGDGLMDNDLDGDGKPDKEHILGFKKARKWVFFSNPHDRTLLRNYFASYLGNEVFKSAWAAKARPVDLYINNVYVGNYLVSEKPQISKQRIDVQNVADINVKHADPKDDAVDVNGDGVVDLKDGGWLVEINYRATGNLSWNSSVYGKDIVYELCDPDEQDQGYSSAVLSHIKNHITNFERALDAVSYSQLVTEWIDEKSLVDWYLLNELSRNSDSIFQASVYFYYDPKDGKIHMGPVWDFDLAWGNAKYCLDKTGWYVWGGSKNEDGKFMQAYWINTLMERPEFKTAVQNRWLDLTVQIQEAIDQHIDYMANEISESAHNNWNKYPEWLTNTTGDNWDCTWLIPEFYSSYDTWEKHVAYFKDFAQTRYNWLDSRISSW